MPGSKDRQDLFARRAVPSRMGFGEMGLDHDHEAVLVVRGKDRAAAFAGRGDRHGLRVAIPPVGIAVPSYPAAMESTFLLADLAGFTALTEAHGDEEAAEVAAEFFDVVRGLLPSYDGEEVKSMGDAVLVRLPEAGAAVRLAARLLGDYGARHRALGIRVGIHTGTAV